ncbi:MAG: c-type cytochrome [Chloroflexi bacterium]|nr:c-type cytochrome [Chloroflexota bacterium]
MFKRTLFTLLVVTLLLAACGGSQPAPAGNASAGNADNGKALFAKATIGKAGAPGCATCHSVEKDKKIVGPSQYGIATDAAATVKEKDYKGTAKTAAEWLRESIVSPNVDVAEGFTPGIMPQNYGKDLSEQEINDLVAYLLTLK